MSIDPTLEAAFLSTANAKIPGPKYSPKFTLGTHTVILKSFKVKQTENKGRMMEADFVVIDSDNKSLIGQSRGAAWFPGSDKFGIQDGYMRQFLESAAQCIGDTSPLPVFGGVLAGPLQAGRGLTMRVLVKEQVAKKTGQSKIDPKTGQAYTEMVWYPVAQSLEDIKNARAALDADPMHALKEDAPAPAPVAVTPPTPVVATVATVQATGTSPLLANLLGKK